MTAPITSRPAISLTYDDALPVHRELVAPELSRRGLHGTFYVPAAAADLHAHREAWRAIAADGHELGNHTTFHPCRGGPQATWVDASYDLRTYNPKRFIDEVILAQAILHSIDGRTQRSFAATCGNLTVGSGADEQDVTTAVLAHASCIRAGIASDPVIHGRPSTLITALHADRATAATVIAAIDQAVATAGWLVVLAHGVGPGTHGLFIEIDEHRRILDHLAALGDVVWAAPVAEVFAARSAAD